MQQPLVTIIGLSYNHAPYIARALHSVKNQTYPNLQVILVDDESSDNSPQILHKFAKENPLWQVLCLPRNVGNTRAFNQAFAHCRGKYVIDFALDDIMHPERVAMQAEAFEKLDEKYGVVYTDAELIDAGGKLLGSFYGAAERKSPLWPPPQGNVFAHVLRRSFISTPTIMIRKKVLDRLGGYDEKLAYEDFDFFVRSSRTWHYHFLDRPLTQKRILAGSLSHNFYHAGRLSFHESTLQICRKAAGLVITGDEKKALAQRLRFQARQALFTGHRGVLPGYEKLLRETGCFLPSDSLFFGLSRWPLPLAGLYRLYHKLRGSKVVS